MSKDLLGAADAILQRNTAQPAAPEESQFVRGLRSGTLGAGSQLSSLGGALAERYGFSGQPMYDTAQSLNERAAEAAPRITSYKDVGSLRDAGDYVAGLLGQSLPASAAALGAAALTRGGLGMRALASGGALTPMEAGDVVQRQQALGAPVDAGEALQTGALSAGLQSVVPAVAGAKLAGSAGGLAAKGGLGAKVAKNALAIPAEGLTEAAGEATKQLGSGQAQDLAGLDTGALAEAFVGGAAAGAPFAAAGAAGDALHGSKGAMRTKMAELGDKAEALKGRLSQKSDPTPGEGVGEGGKTQPAGDTGLADGLMGFYDKAKTKVSDAADRVIAGKPLRDNPEYAETPPDSPAYQDLLKRMDGEHLAQAKQWGEDMLTKAGSWLTPERRAEVEQAMGDLGDQANRVKIATLEKGRAAAEQAKGLATQLTERVKGWADEKGLTGTKKSEDYSGVRQLIADEVAPVVRETSPGLMEDAEGMQTLADGLRVFMEHAARTERKALPADVSRDLFEIMGDKTIPTLRKLYRAVQGENGGDTAKTEAFFSTLNDMMAQRKADTKLYDVMTKSLKPELQKTSTTGELRQEAELLQRWASRPAKDSAQDKVDSALIRERLQERYGSKAEAVLDAIERNRRVEESALADEGRVGVDEDGQPLAQQKADHTDALTERETDANESDALEKAGLSAMRFKGGAGADDRRTSPRALRTHPEKPDTDVLDAVAMTREMRTSQPYQDGEVTGKRRDARMFKEAVARVTEKLGRSFEIPDRTIINESGMTWGQAKSFSDDRGPSQNDRKLQKLRDDYRKAKAARDDGRMNEIAERAQRLLDERDASIVNDGERERTAAQDYLEAQGKESADPKNDNIHLAAATLTPDELQIKTGMDEQPLTKSTRPTPDSLKGALDSRIKRMEVGRKFDETKGDFVGPVNAVAKRVGEKARALYEIYDDMQPMDRAALIGSTQGKVSEAAPTINALHKKYIENKAAPEVAAQGPKAQLERLARSGDASLLQAIRKNDDAAQLQRAADHLNSLKDIRDSRIVNAVDELNKRIGELAQDPDVAYNLQRTSAQQTGSARVTQAQRDEVKQYLDRVLGTQVKRLWSKIMHAGEFDAATETIRISVHALNPLSVAHHEALHAFMHKMRQAGASEPMRVLFQAADSAHVRRQLERLLASEPEALKQLNDAEERAAYMYQFWATGQLRLGEQPRGVLGRLAALFRRTLRMWSNDERALHIMEYFHDGEFNRDPTSVHALQDVGKNRALQRAKDAVEPVARLSDSIFTAGGQRMRDTGVPALVALADKMKRANVQEGDDPGYIPAARTERTRVMNTLGQRLLNFNKEHLNEALEALQRGDVDSASSPEARLAGKYVRRTLDEMFNYMQSAGVRINDLGVGKDYFPRMYDTNAISKKQQEFLDVLDRHGVKNSREVLHKLMTTEGSEFTVETMKPGMQNLKPRTLAHIPDAELAPFMRKDLFEVMNSYVTQATRRAEWARRFKDDGSGLRDLLKEAKDQGAKAHELEAAERYVRGVDGTLGDTINPTARRLMGNMIVYQNVRLLPLAIFSSVVDPAGIVVRGGTVGDAWHALKRGVRETVKNFQSMPDKDGMTELAETLGVVDSATLIHTLGASYSQGMVGDSARKINDWFFRANLMEQFNTSMRVGATEAALKFLQRHNDGKASPHSARWLAELGLKAGDVKTGPDGRVLLTEADGLSAEQAARMRVAVNRWVDGAVLRPDASDKPIWMNDPHWALVAHLKQFVYSFHETILKRVVHEFEHGNYTPVMALASYVPIMIASDLIKGALTNAGDQPEWKKNWGVSDYVWSGIERGGLLGVGQFRVDMMGDVARGGTGIGAMAGPTLEQLGDAVKTLGGREAFGHFALKSLPANALYANALGGEGTDPKFVD